MPDDIVTELERWLDTWPVGDDPMDMIQRARDEIAALRALINDERKRAGDEIVALRNLAFSADDLKTITRASRRDALEEAAQVMEQWDVMRDGIHTNGKLAAAIRALR